MKRFNKFLALFLAVVMTVGLLPAAVSAAADPNVIYEQNFDSYTTSSTLQVNASLKAWRTVQYYPYNHLDSTAPGAYTFITEGSNTYVKLNAIPSSQNQANSFTLGSLFVGFKRTDTTYPIAAGDTYKVTARVKANKDGSNVKFTANTSPWKSDFNYSEAQTGVVGTDWTEVNYTFTVPHDNYDSLQIRVGLDAYTSSSDTYLMVDDIRISKVIPYGYETVVDELAEGNAQLQADVDGTGNHLVLKSNKTLDLNGHTLTVDSLTALKGANVIDSVGGGKLVVAEEALLLQKNNSYLPIKVAGGYIFVTVKNQHELLDAEADTLMYRTRPALVNVTSSTYLGDGAADNGLSIMIRLTWTNTLNGTTTTMDVPCSDELVENVYTNKDAFVLSVTGVGSVENLKVATVICSDTGVVFVGDALSYNAQ